MKKKSYFNFKCSSDNNVNKVTQQLLTLGHQKKDKPQPLTPRRSLMTPTPVPKETVEMPTSPKKLPSFAEMFQSISLNSLIGK